MVKTDRVVIVVLFVVAWAPPLLSGPPGLSAADIEAVRAAHQAYVDAWLANDPDAVMSTLTDDAVLLPHHGNEPVVGKEAIRNLWFPDGRSSANVVHMVNSVAEVQGHGDLAFVWGRNELAYTYRGTTYRNSGNYLSVMRKGPDGGWRIARRIWNDPIAEED